MDTGGGWARGSPTELGECDAPAGFPGSRWPGQPRQDPNVGLLTARPARPPCPSREPWMSLAAVRGGGGAGMRAGF